MRESEIIIVGEKAIEMKTEEWMRLSETAKRLDADAVDWKAAARTTNCTLGNINGHAVGHDGWKTDVATYRKSLVCGPTERIIFVSRQVIRKHIVEYVQVKGNMHVWETFRVFLPSFDGGRVHSPTQVGQDE